ncbi:MAG: succinate dehydrogenase, hydrophobic membrane anchor protein, partial [Hoeflea sp.]|nr:succinate dehydrogenase, hydrophobic membrane anchor protein [Hoeflea sp.]
MIVRYRTSHAAATGLGVAGHGVGHWRAQRASAIALVPLALWLAFSLADGVAADHAMLNAWLGVPVNAILMILLVFAAFHH